MTFLSSPTPLVIDASVAVDLLAEGDETIAARWRDWSETGRLILAPPLLWLELANALLRNKKLSAATVAAYVSDFEATGVETADRGLPGVRASIELAARHGLSVYDASYLWLAIDVDGELATADKALIRAARAEGVTLAFD